VFKINIGAFSAKIFHHIEYNRIKLSVLKH